jgi:hypothetical protein
MKEIIKAMPAPRNWRRIMGVPGLGLHHPSGTPETFGEFLLSCFIVTESTLVGVGDIAERDHSAF